MNMYSNTHINDTKKMKEQELTKSNNFAENTQKKKMIRIIKMNTEYCQFTEHCSIFIQPTILQKSVLRHMHIFHVSSYIWVFNTLLTCWTTHSETYTQTPHILHITSYITKGTKKEQLVLYLIFISRASTVKATHKPKSSRHGVVSVDSVVYGLHIFFFNVENRHHFQRISFNM